MITLPADVPVALVAAHVVTLTTLFIHASIVGLRRFVLIRQSRRDAPNTLWMRLLQVSLGLPG